MSPTGEFFITLRRMRWVYALSLACFVSTLWSCAGGRMSKEQAHAYVLDKPDVLRPVYQRVAQSTERNNVLYQMEASLAAADLGFHSLAEESLDFVLGAIESIYAKDPDAEKARSTWHKEGRKKFRGEPYERAMAYFYRGLLYLRRGDHENARACFRNGNLQDAFAEDDQDRSDFATMWFLEGWCSRALGNIDEMNEAWREVQRLRPAWSPPAREQNVLLVVETGMAPIKYKDGLYDEQLRFARGTDFEEATYRISQVHEEFAATRVAAFTLGASGAVAEDIHNQASTRGERPIDYVLKGKANFKKQTGETGKEATVFGLQIIIFGLYFFGASAAGGGKDSKNDAAAAAFVAGFFIVAAGAVVTMFGLTFWGISALVRPEADARYWPNLPDKVYLHTVALEPGVYNFRADFGAKRGGDLKSDMSRYFDLSFDGRGQGFGWGRSRPALLDERFTSTRTFIKEKQP